MFDKGETFAGVPYDIGLQAVDAIKEVFPAQPNLAPIALRWILDFNAVSCIIPGVSKLPQLYSNLSASEMKPMSQAQKERLQAIYEEDIRQHVHHLW